MIEEGFVGGGPQSTCGSKNTKMRGGGGIREDPRTALACQHSDWKSHVEAISLFRHRSVSSDTPSVAIQEVCGSRVCCGDVDPQGKDHGTLGNRRAPTLFRFEVETTGKVMRASQRLSSSEDPISRRKRKVNIPESTPLSMRGMRETFEADGKEHYSSGNTETFSNLNQISTPQLALLNTLAEQVGRCASAPFCWDKVVWYPR